MRVEYYVEAIGLTLIIVRDYEVSYLTESPSIFNMTRVESACKHERNDDYSDCFRTIQFVMKCFKSVD